VVVEQQAPSAVSSNSRYESLSLVNLSHLFEIERSVMIKLLLYLLLGLFVFQPLQVSAYSDINDMFWRADLHVGSRWLDYDKLNSRLAAVGYPTVSNGNTLYGFTIGSSDRDGGGGVVIDAHRSLEKFNGHSTELMWASFDYFLHYDYSFKRRMDITPSFSLSYDHLSLKLDSYDHRSFNVTIKPALTINLFSKKGKARGKGVYLTARCGYVLPIYVADWRINAGSPAQTLPKVNMSGVLFHIGIGWSAWGL
jgi:hypothetical protein